ncbi:hypothetical protein [Nisaea sp.]
MSISYPITVTGVSQERSIDSVLRAARAASNGWSLPATRDMDD